jgi:hypothetical protein
LVLEGCLITMHAGARAPGENEAMQRKRAHGAAAA